MTKNTHILVVDDDREIRDLVGIFLKKHDFSVITAANGEQMMQALEKHPVDLIVLDVMMPGQDGLTLTRNLRAADNNVPVIMLTAAGEEIDRILGLEMGADDYLPKPFNPRELLARIRSVLRRTTASTSIQPANPAELGEKLAFERYSVEMAARRVLDSSGNKVGLSSGEFDLLCVFLANAGHVLSRDRLLDLTKGREATPFDRSVDILVSRLRKKLEDDPKDPRIITTVRGGGYMFIPKPVREGHTKT